MNFFAVNLSWMFVVGLGLLVKTVLLRRALGAWWGWRHVDPRSLTAYMSGALLRRASMRWLILATWFGLGAWSVAQRPILHPHVTPAQVLVTVGLFATVALTVLDALLDARVYHRTMMAPWGPERRHGWRLIKEFFKELLP